MKNSPIPALFLGAGASVASGLPTWPQMLAVLDVSLTETAESASGPRLASLLDHIKERGVGFETLSGLMVTGGVPTTAHMIAARVLKAGGPVLTVNWDDMVERACATTSIAIHVLMPPAPCRCTCNLPHLYKVHGEPHRLTPDVPTVDRLPADWAAELPAILGNRDVAVYGYSARDEDVREPLLSALAKSEKIDWFTLPDQKAGLEGFLKDLIASAALILHSSNDPAPLFMAWASARGLATLAQELPDPPMVHSGSQTAQITPRVLALIHVLGRRPTDVQSMNSRAFEELVAGLLAGQGYGVKLTQPSKDGGIDVWASKHDPLLGELVYLVQCKRYSATHKVGVSPVRDLYGLVSARNATGGLVVTSGFFTKGAQAFRDSVANRMTLHDFDSIVRWIARH